MTSKTIKTVLFSTIILSLVIPVAGFSLAEAKISADKIPNDKLLERNDGWKSKYASIDEFEKSENAIQTYVSNVHPANPWNKQTKKNQIILYNFNTLSDSRQAGLNAVLTDVKNQKASGSYAPTVAERLFHEWAAKQISAPTMPDVKQDYIDDVIAAYNSNANYGNVPASLFDSDAEFWMNIASEKRCEITPGCEEARKNITDPDATAFGLMPFAYATVWSTYHELDTWVEANSCETGSCKYSDDDSGQGVLNTSQHGGSNHSTSKTIKYYIKDKSFVNNYDVDHEISATLQLGSSDVDIGPLSGTNEIVLDSSYYFSSVTCGSSHCGTFSLSAQAEDATFET